MSFEKNQRIVFSFWKGRSIMLKKGIIWGLHSVEPDSFRRDISPMFNYLNLTPARLEQLIIAARDRGYTFVSLDRFLRDKADDQEHKNIVITIDDGWKNIYTYAYPVFKKHNVPFVFYIATDLIENGFNNCRLPEMDGLLLLCDKINALPLTLPQKQHRFKRFWWWFKYIKRVLPFLSGHQIMSFLLHDSHLDFAAYHRAGACSVADLQEMAADDLCQIGSHTNHHSHMDRVPDPAAEALLSQAKLTEWLNRPCTHFSYPYGHHNSASDAIIRAHYNSAVLVNPADPALKRRYITDADDTYALHRIFIESDTPIDDLLLPV